MNDRSPDDLTYAIRHGNPRVHATGFAQLYLAPDTRLHVWSDELFAAAPDVSQIAFYHDHRYGIDSTVLHGMLLDSPAVAQRHYSQAAIWQVWEVRPAHEGEPDRPQLVNDMGGYDVVLPAPRLIRAGESYHIPKRTFHASRGIGTVVTVMHKVDEEEAWARLLVPQGFDPVHSLIKQPPVEWLRDCMIRAVYAWQDALEQAFFDGAQWTPEQLQQFAANTDTAPPRHGLLRELAEVRKLGDY